jgi:hypothetical protein
VAKKKRIPKTIAGVKLPKELRRAGEKVIDQVQRPETQAALAGALSLAAGAIATAAKSRTAHPPEPPVPPVPPAPPVPPVPPHAAVPPHSPEPPRPGEGGIHPDKVGEMVGEIVGGVMEKLFGDRKPRTGG